MDSEKSDKFCLSSMRTLESGLGLGRWVSRVANWDLSESGGGGDMLVSSLLMVTLPTESGRKSLPRAVMFIF